MERVSPPFSLDGDEGDVNRYYLAQGWTDGLPILPPTVQRVEAMLADRNGEEALGPIPPRWDMATVEALAVNAVMAGCEPEWFPVVLAAVQAMLEPEFNLFGVQATTNPVAPLLLVSGPLAAEWGIASGAGALGPGFPANAAIGRAIRLILQNIGGAKPGDTDRATLGQPGKFTMCLAENEASSPWPPLRLSYGMEPHDTMVLVVGASGTQNIIDQGSRTAEGILVSLVSNLCVIGTNNIYYGGDPLLLISPEHADTLAAGGYDPASLQQLLFERARVPLSAFSRDNVELVLQKRRPHWFETGMPDAIPVVDRPEDLLIAVAGGPGKHSVFVPTFGVNRSVAKKVVP